MTEPTPDRKRRASDHALATGGVPLDPYPGYAWRRGRWSLLQLLEAADLVVAGGPGELEGFADDVQVGSVGVEVAVGHADLAAAVGPFDARSAVGGGQGCR